MSTENKFSCTPFNKNFYLIGLCEMENKLDAHTNKLEAQYIKMAIKDADAILLKYSIEKKEEKFKITYRKKIPSKYWHCLYNYYCDFRNALTKNLPLSSDKKITMDLYIKIIPTLIHFQKVRKHTYFSKWRQFYYDHIKKFEDEIE